ncbi:MAG: TonB-dependent receptor [Bacteroidota bacterium]
MRKSYWLGILFLCLGIMPSFAQRTISGSISDEQGNLLIGATIMAKGTSVGTTTDLNGQYELKVPNEVTTLVFSYLGYVSTEVALGTSNVINFTLKSSTVVFDEIIVTGYSTELKREITSAITSVNNREIEGLAVQSLDRAIQGKVSGVQIASESGAPGGAATIRVRGVGSISAGSAPLIIVDGVQVGRQGQSGQGSANPLNGINPNDIASIEILKDAASTSIYGAQGANGIILVTTKTGRKGKKAKFNVAYQEGVVQPMNLYEVMNSQQYADIRQAALANAGQSLEEAQTLYGNPNDANLPYFDWKSAIWRNATLRTLDFSFNGGSEKVDYYTAFSYNLQEGQIITNEWERITGRFNLNAQLLDNFSVSLRTSLAFIEQEGQPCDGGFWVNCPFAPSFWSIPSSPAFDENGDYNAYPTNGEGHNFNFNEIQNAEEVTRLGQTLQNISSLTLNYEPIPNLKASAFIGIDYVNNKDQQIRPISIPFFRDAWGGQILNEDRIAVNWNTFSTLQYAFSINEKHDFSALLGFEYKQEDWSTFSATGRGLADPSFQNLNSAATPFAIAGTSSTNRREGVFSSIKYNFNDQYFANATVRYDGSSRFGSNNRWGLFYAGSLGWRLNTAPFLQDVAWIEELKVRLSYGITGNSEIADFAALPEFGTRGQYLGAPGLAPIKLANSLLGWEEAEQLDLGIDFSFFENRVYGSIDLWNKNNRDLLLATQIPAAAGIEDATFVENVGRVNNRGIDLELSGVVYNQGGFTWRIGGTLSFQRNRVEELNGGRDTIFNDGFPQLIAGQPIHFFNLLPFAGVNPANGRAMVYDQNGFPTYAPNAQDVQVFKGAIPDFFGGLRTEMSYRGLSLESFFQFQGGHYVYNNDLEALAEAGGSPNNQLVSQVNYWKQPGDITNVHQPYQGNVIRGIDQIDFGLPGTTRFYSDASYLRLKEIRLAYTFPRSLLSSLKISNLTVFTQGLNLVTWTRFDGIDPEVVATRQAYTERFPFAFPLGRQYSFGLNMAF